MQLANDALDSEVRNQATLVHDSVIHSELFFPLHYIIYQFLGIKSDTDQVEQGYCTIG